MSTRRPLSAAQARQLDRDAVHRLGMPSLLLMENAARGVAEVARTLGERFVILCGPGNNGGDGLAAARHLGRAATVCLLAEPDPVRSPDAATNLPILRNAGWPVAKDPPADTDPDVVWIDALFGTGLTRPLSGAAAEWVRAFNAARGRKLAVDLPSGMDGDTGLALGGICCRADVTVTFHANKLGLEQPAARENAGRVIVVTLGLPEERGPATG